jgi:hypothetical protein
MRAFAVTGAMLLLAALPGWVGAQCATKGPEQVLSCIEDALRTQDWKVLEDVISEGFEKSYRGEASVVGKAEWITAQQEIATGADVRGYTFAFAPGYIVTGGTNGDWVLSPVNYRIEFEGRDQHGVWRSLWIEKTTAEFHVQEISDVHGSPRYVVKKWIADVGQ